MLVNYLKRENVFDSIVLSTGSIPGLIVFVGLRDGVDQGRGSCG